HVRSARVLQVDALAVGLARPEDAVVEPPGRGLVAVGESGLELAEVDRLAQARDVRLLQRLRLLLLAPVAEEPREGLVRIEGDVERSRRARQAAARRGRGRIAWLRLQVATVRGIREPGDHVEANRAAPHAGKVLPRHVD